MIAPENWERIRALFQTALERPAEERAEFLREQSAGDESLRREVEALLAAHADAPSFLDDPSFGPPFQPLHAAARQLTSGSRLGVFELLGPLGSGGMGDVYKARDTRLNRTVAIKVLASPLEASPDFRKRFEREARILAGLSHPHICTLHDVGH